MANWRATVTAAFMPTKFYGRFVHQVRHTYPNRRHRHIGIRADYRRDFWSVAGPLLRQGRIEKVIHIATVSHHMVTFAREVQQGTAEKCFYNPHVRPGHRHSCRAGTGCFRRAAPAAPLEFYGRLAWVSNEGDESRRLVRGSIG